VAASLDPDWIMRDYDERSFEFRAAHNPNALIQFLGDNYDELSLVGETRSARVNSCSAARSTSHPPTAPST
jgi:hypothetical protein